MEEGWGGGGVESCRETWTMLRLHVATATSRVPGTLHIIAKGKTNRKRGVRGNRVHCALFFTSCLSTLRGIVRLAGTRWPGTHTTTEATTPPPHQCTGICAYPRTHKCPTPTGEGRGAIGHPPIHLP